MAKIMCHFQHNALNVPEQFMAEWLPSEYPTLAIAFVNRGDAEHFGGRSDMQIGDVFQLGGLRLRVVELRAEMDAYEVMQDGWHARLVAVVNPLHFALGLIRARFIITLAVWGLARYSMACPPTWRDVYGIDWIATRLEHVAAWIRTKLRAGRLPHVIGQIESIERNDHGIEITARLVPEMRRTLEKSCGYSVDLELK